MEEGCGVHLDPGDVRGRTKVRLVVEALGVATVAGVHQLHRAYHRQNNSQADHLIISDNSGNTEIVSCGLGAVVKVSKGHIHLGWEYNENTDFFGSPDFST